MDRLNVEIQNASISAEEKLKEYAAKANNSDMVNAIHSAGTKIASTGKKVGKLASDHPFVTVALLTGLPFIIMGAADVTDSVKRRRQKEIDERHKELKDELYQGIMRDRYDVDITNSNPDNINNLVYADIAETDDMYKRRKKYLYNHDQVSTKTVPQGPINKDKINEAYKKNK